MTKQDGLVHVCPRADPPCPADLAPGKGEKAMIIKLRRGGMLSLARPPSQVPGALGAFRLSAPLSSYAYSGDPGQRRPCCARESFGDYAAAEGELPGDATEILLRLTQDVGLRVSPRSTPCGEQETTPPSPHLIIVLAGGPDVYILTLYPSGCPGPAQRAGRAGHGHPRRQFPVRNVTAQSLRF